MGSTERDSEAPEESKSDVSTESDLTNTDPSGSPDDPERKMKEWNSYRRQDPTPDQKPVKVPSGARNHMKGRQIGKVNVHEKPAFVDAAQRDNYDNPGHDHNQRTSQAEYWELWIYFHMRTTKNAANIISSRMV